MVPSKASLTLLKNRKPCLQFNNSFPRKNSRAQLSQSKFDLQERQHIPKINILSDSSKVVYPNNIYNIFYHKVYDHEIGPCIDYVRSNVITKNGQKTKITDYQNHLEDLIIEHFQPIQITSSLSLSNSVRYYTQDVISRQYGNGSTKDSKQWAHYSKIQECQPVDCSDNNNYAQGLKSRDCSNRAYHCPQQHESLQYNYNETSKSYIEQEPSSRQHYQPTPQSYGNSAQENCSHDDESLKYLRQQEFESYKQQQSMQSKNNESIEGSMQRDHTTNQQYRSTQCQYNQPSELSNQKTCHYEHQQQYQEQQKQRQCSHQQQQQGQQQRPDRQYYSNMNKQQYQQQQKLLQQHQEQQQQLHNLQQQKEQKQCTRHYHQQQEQQDQQHHQPCSHSEQQDQHHLGRKCNNLSTSSNQQKQCPSGLQSAQSACNIPVTNVSEKTNISCHQQPSHTMHKIIQSFPRARQESSMSCNQPQTESLRDKIARICGCNCNKPSPSDTKNSNTLKTRSSTAGGLLSRLWKCKSPATPKVPKCGCCESPLESTNELGSYPLPVKPIHWTEKKQSGSQSQTCGPEVFIPYHSSIRPKSKQQPSPRKIDLRDLIQDPTKCQRMRTEGKSESKGFNKARQESFSSNSSIVQFGNEKMHCFKLPRGAKTGDELRSEASFAALGSSSYRRPQGSFKIDDVSNTNPNTSTLKYRLAKCPTLKQMWQHADCQLPKAIVQPIKLPRPIPVTRRKVAPLKPTGEWMQQKYPIRLRIFKSKDSLEPSLPATAEFSRDRSNIDSSMLEPSKFKQMDRDNCKMKCPCYPPPKKSTKSVSTLIEESNKRGQRLKRAKTCLPCPNS